MAHGIPLSTWAASAMKVRKWTAPIPDNGLGRLAGNSMSAPNALWLQIVPCTALHCAVRVWLKRVA